MSTAQARVISLLPRTASFSEAVRLFRAASLEECVGALHGNASLEANLLRGRALLRLGKPGKALVSLREGEAQAQIDASSHVRGQLAMLIAAASFRTGDVAGAQENFSAARAYVWSTTDTDLHAELSRHVALMEWAGGNLQQAEEHARQALRGASPLSKALALELLGAIEANRGHFHTQASCLEEALDFLEELPERDPFAEASILRNLAILSRDLPLLGVAERVEGRAESLAWTSALASTQHEVLKHLGWCAAVRGDHLKAFRLLRASGEIAPTAAWQVTCFLDRSFLAREMRERLFAAAELESAEALAKSIDWEETSGEERCALLLLAELLAPQDAMRGQALIDRYRSIKRKMSVLVNQRDGRLRAAECHAFGVVAAAAGERGRAAEMLDEAFELWSSIGFVYRATRTALEMAELTGDDRRLGYAREHVGKFPNSWFSRSSALASDRDVVEQTA